jgi:hypothetical protein
VIPKHSKSFSLIDCISAGVDWTQRNFGPMGKQVVAWQRTELTDVTAKESFTGYATTTVTKTADWRMPTCRTGLRKQRQHVNLSSASSPADGYYEMTSGQGRSGSTKGRFCPVPPPRRTVEDRAGFLITPLSASSFSCC